jgi:hypothetical protein
MGWSAASSLFLYYQLMKGEEEIELIQNKLQYNKQKRSKL